VSIEIRVRPVGADSPVAVLVPFSFAAGV
jgi:hypothetical protein